MSGLNPATPAAPLTNEAVAAAARAEVERVLAHKDSTNQMAATVERVMLQAHKAEANLAETQAKLTVAEQKLASTEAELAEAKKKLPTGEPTNVKDANKDAKDNKGTPPKGEAAVVIPDQATAALQAQVNELTQALAAEKKKNDKMAWTEKAKARKAKAEKAGVKSKKFLEKAEASAEDGTPVMSDADFESTLEILAEEAAPATAADTGGNPVAAPTDAAGPAQKDKAKSLTGKDTSGGTPIPAPKDDAGPASKQNHPKMAHATTDPAPQATASEVPAAPDLTGAEIMAQATAALMQCGPAVSQSGKSNYAKAFGI
jgi:hypothetical protein